MIIFRNVTKQFGNDEPVLRDVTFDIPQGNFAYLVGMTGSGKTTIFRLIIKDLAPSEGEVRIGEWDIGNLPRKKIPQLRRKVGVIFQDYKLLTDRTVFENVLLPLEIARIPAKEAIARAEEVLTEVGLTGKFEKFPQQLSGGESQRVAIARALVFEPEIIIADEPTGNLDQATSQQIVDVLKRINEKLGTTMFVATHNEKVIGNDDNDVYEIKSGRVSEKRKKQTTKPKQETVKAGQEEKKDNSDDKKEDKNDSKKS